MRKLFVLCLIIGTSVVSVAQEKESENFKFRSFGISMGIYEPELDYWKNDSSSAFQGQDFTTNLFVQGYTEFRLVKGLVAKLGLGYWQTTSKTTVPKYGPVKMFLTGIPVSLDMVFYLSVARFSIFTPYVGAGGEYVFIQYNLDFEDKENPDAVNGSSLLGSALLGLEAKVSKNFTIDLFVEYKFGSYQQSFVRELTSTDPDVPSSQYEVTEDISFTGPKYGISFKYLF